MAAPKDKESQFKRRTEVLSFMESIGPFSIPASALAEKHGVTVKVIYNDRDFWIKKIDFKRMDFEGKRLIHHILKNLSIVEEERASGDPMKRLKAVQASNQTAETYTRLLEKYGFKEVVEDKLRITGSLPVEINLIEQSVEAIKHGRLNNQPKAEGNAESPGR